MEIFLITLFIVICILLIGVVLLQKGRGGGLGAAFGGAGSSAFGARTGDVFTWVTIVLVTLFLVLAVVTSLKFRQRSPVPSVMFDPMPTATGITGEITVNIAKVGDRIVKIFYTTDGSEPTLDSSEYVENAVPVKPGTTLRARAYVGQRPGSILSAAYLSPEEIAKAAAEASAANQPTAAPPVEPEKVLDLTKDEKTTTPATAPAE